MHLDLEGEIMGMGTLSRSDRKHRERRQARLAGKRALPQIIAEQLEADAEERQLVVIMNTAERQRRASLIAGINPLTNRQFTSTSEYISALGPLKPLSKEESKSASSVMFDIDYYADRLREWEFEDYTEYADDHIDRDSLVDSDGPYPVYAA